MKGFKIFAKILLSLVLLVILVVAWYVLYLVFAYYRIEDRVALNLAGSNEAAMPADSLAGREFTVATYNIGFGAYDQEFSFFMDTGYMKDTGKKVTGKMSRAKDKAAVEASTAGVIEEIKRLSPDFAFYQEVDENSHRSYQVNQYAEIMSAFDGYNAAYAPNFHSAYLFYPLTRPHGSVNSGILTLSKYKTQSAERRRFIVDETFPWKFFDLDRCFSVSIFDLEGDKDLVLINVHMSAYDSGGKIRVEQLKQLKEVMYGYYNAGHYVIAGGDFNHDIASEAAGGKDSLSPGGDNDLFPSAQLRPDWVQQMTIKDDFSEGGFAFAAAVNTPTCRGSDIPYAVDENGVMKNYGVVIDGFIYSDNIDPVTVYNIDNQFKYSDHQPAVFKFKLS